MSVAPHLTVEDLRKAYELRRSATDRLRRRPPQRTAAVDGVSFTLARGETLGIVGESGSGKTTLARCLLRLEEPDAGAVVIDGEDVLGAARPELRRLRRRLQMVFQDPYSSLNPRLTIAQTLAEPALVHGVVPRAGLAAHVAELLERVGLPPAVAKSRPRTLSGGQRQRVAIARALSAGPELLIADEAVSALDASVQAQILNLLMQLRADLGLTMIFIAHQLPVVAHVADRLAVMYHGRIVETGPTAAVMRAPAHPYTAALLAASPTLEPGRRVRSAAPPPTAVASTPGGCRYRERCAFAQERCSREDPALQRLPESREAACVVLPFDQARAGAGQPARKDVT